MPPRADRCAVPRCRRPPILTYLDRFPICEAHWDSHGEKYHLLVKLGRVPSDFPERVRRLRALLRKGSEEEVRKEGPWITGKVPLDVFRVYLKDELAEKLPIGWDLKSAGSPGRAPVPTDPHPGGGG